MLYNFLLDDVARKHPWSSSPAGAGIECTEDIHNPSKQVSEQAPAQALEPKRTTLFPCSLSQTKFFSWHFRTAFVGQMKTSHHQGAVHDHFRMSCSEAGITIFSFALRPCHWRLAFVFLFLY